MGHEVLDDAYDHNRRNVTHISSSRTSTSTRGLNTASEDNRKRSRSVLMVEDQKPRITHGYSSEKRPSHGRTISTTKERLASAICIRYAALCLKVKDFPECPFGDTECRFRHVCPTVKDSVRLIEAVNKSHFDEDLCDKFKSAVSNLTKDD